MPDTTDGQPGSIRSEDADPTSVLEDRGPYRGTGSANRGVLGRKELGSLGEAAAAEYLRARGLGVVARNWRSRHGEIDLVMREGRYLVFVEVKLRFGDFDPLDAVDARKQRRISLVAIDYLLRLGDIEHPARFDVVAVDGDTMACTHVANAFDCAIDY